MFGISSTGFIHHGQDVNEKYPGNYYSKILAFSELGSVLIGILLSINEPIENRNKGFYH